MYVQQTNIAISNSHMELLRDIFTDQYKYVPNELIIQNFLQDDYVLKYVSGIISNYKNENPNFLILSAHVFELIATTCVNCDLEIIHIDIESLSIIMKDFDVCFVHNKLEVCLHLKYC